MAPFPRGRHRISPGPLGRWRVRAVGVILSGGEDSPGGPSPFPHPHPLAGLLHRLCHRHGSMLELFSSAHFSTHFRVVVQIAYGRGVERVEGMRRRGQVTVVRVGEIWVAMEKFSMVTMVTVHVVSFASVVVRVGPLMGVGVSVWEVEVGGVVVREVSLGRGDPVGGDGREGVGEEGLGGEGVGGGV